MHPQITAADIPATPAAATCKAILDGAAVQFAAGGIAAVTQVAGATISNYVSSVLPLVLQLTLVASLKYTLVFQQLQKLPGFFTLTWMGSRIPFVSFFRAVEQVVDHSLHDPF